MNCVLLELTNPTVDSDEETDTTFHSYKVVWLKWCCLNGIDWFVKAKRNCDNCVKWKESEVNIYRHSVIQLFSVHLICLSERRIYYVSHYYHSQWIGWLTNSISITIRCNAQCDLITVDQWALNTEYWIWLLGIIQNQHQKPIKSYSCRKFQLYASITVG